ncbi:MAG: hypothetical protein EBQ95_01860 [Gammaproteobacteria bacterium]|nr:hypothetical protein [Gammaproteobacteria bacterium]
MSYEALSTPADVLRMVGMVGIVIAPVAATIALDVAILLWVQENTKDHPFFSGMLFGAFLGRSGPGIFVPRMDSNNEFNSFELTLAIVLSAISTASCAIACALLASPMIALGIAIAWSSCLGIYMLGEGLRGLAQEETKKIISVNAEYHPTLVQATIVSN